MTPKKINNFINESFLRPPKKIYSTNKTNFLLTSDLWFLEMKDIKDSGPENNGGQRYVLVVIDIFSNYGLTVP